MARAEAEEPARGTVDRARVECAHRAGPREFVHRRPLRANAVKCLRYPLHPNEFVDFFTVIGPFRALIKGSSIRQILQ